MSYPQGFVEWLANGRRGSSSNAIATQLSGVDCCSRYSSVKDYPHDPADFLRCSKLLLAVPEFKERLHEMSVVSPVWAALVNKWAAVDASLATEMDTRTDGRAPRTYKMMKDVIAIGRKAV